MRHRIYPLMHFMKILSTANVTSTVAVSICVRRMVKFNRVITSGALPMSVLVALIGLADLCVITHNVRADIALTVVHGINVICLILYTCILTLAGCSIPMALGIGLPLAAVILMNVLGLIPAGYENEKKHSNAHN